jgi:hypothetical protein
MTNDLATDGIDGPYTLTSSAGELAATTRHLLDDILPNPPQRRLALWFARLLWRREAGSVSLLRFQSRNRHFFMERHLDSVAVRQLCNDPELRRRLAKHLGEILVLWRSEIWVSRPNECLIPAWHHDAYPHLLRGPGRNVNVYIALSDIDHANGFEYLPASVHDERSLPVVSTDRFSGNRFFAIRRELEERAVRLRLRAGEFVLFSDDLVHRSVRNSNGQTRVALTLRVAPPSLRILRGYTPSYGPVRL